MPRPREKSPMFWRLAIGGMLTGVFGLFALIAFNVPPATDLETACRLDRKDPAHTVLLIDQSDPFNPNDFGWVEEFVDAEARLLPKYGRLTVLTPNVERPYDPVEVFSACSPGSAADANPILENPRMIEATWRTTFFEPLQGRVAALLEETRQEASPLSEAIYSVADRADFKRGADNRRFVIVSDLMQHSDGFSFYKTGADTAAFSDSRLGKEVPDMHGVDVVARIVPRNEYDLPMDAVKTFWASYFDGAGAQYRSVN
ncbi:MAG: hypothetical protein AAFQ21_04300 [Pseudomonadota bacterium]